MLDIQASVGLGGVNNPDDVRRVQYLLNKTSPANGGPSTPFDTVPGLNSTTLEDAIKHFQTGRTPVVDSRVDPGRSTIQKLNALADLTAYNAVREPDEFLSWLRRPPEWNFTLEDLITLGGGLFTFTANTQAWLPLAYQANIAATIWAVLDPTDTLPGSWGIGAWDLYHGHIVVPMNPATGLPFPVAETQAAAVRLLQKSLYDLQDEKRPDTLTTPADIADYSTKLQAILTAFTAPLNALLATGVASIYYHSFESSMLFHGNTRFTPFNEADPRRNWLTPLGVGVPTKYASADHPDKPISDFYQVLEIVFLMDKTGLISVVADIKPNLIAVTGRLYKEIN